MRSRRNIPQTLHITLSKNVLKRCKFGWAKSVIIGTSRGNCNAFHSVSPLPLVGFFWNFRCRNGHPSAATNVKFVANVQ